MTITRVATGPDLARRWGRLIQRHPDCHLCPLARAADDVDLAPEHRQPPADGEHPQAATLVLCGRFRRIEAHTVVAHFNAGLPVGPAHPYPDAVRVRAFGCIQEQLAGRAKEEFASGLFRNLDRGVCFDLDRQIEFLLRLPAQPLQSGSPPVIVENPTSGNLYAGSDIKFTSGIPPNSRSRTGRVTWEVYVM